jgi:ubiquinone/menaquinone biosynthesis C-methylase UbiE
MIVREVKQMSDVWSSVAELESEAQTRLADVLEIRGANAGQRAMRREFLTSIPFPPRARVLEIGCGTGVLTRQLAALRDVREVVGIDSAPSLLARARELSSNLPAISYQQADARALPFEAASFDVVVFDSVLCHIPCPERALAEARRVMRAGACLAIFDGDYATTTVALGDHDPLQSCVDAMMSTSVNDRWLVRRLPMLLRAANFEIESMRGHSYVETSQADYLLTVVDRGADGLCAAGHFSQAAAAALKAEARERIEQGRFFGHIAYVSVIARAP